MRAVCSYSIKGKARLGSNPKCPDTDVGTRKITCQLLQLSTAQEKFVILSGYQNRMIGILLTELCHFDHLVWIKIALPRQC